MEQPKNLPPETLAPETPATPWEVPAEPSLPQWLRELIRGYSPGADGRFAAQLLWQRGWRDGEASFLRNRDAITKFLDLTQYSPSEPFSFSGEMRLACDRLHLARQNDEKVAIWGDFDADGITSTAVLWEGLSHWFEPSAGPEQRLTYYIPNRLTESHGLSLGGLQKLEGWGAKLIITCDTGSTDGELIELANRMGMEVIVTDHHSLAEQRPNVVALINPRSLDPEHPLADLSGVAVAYKLIEALHQGATDAPAKLLTQLLPLVAIGLIADLVALRGDCRYLAQVGLRELQQLTRSPNQRPGVAYLLERCKRTGDRPTDISFGIGPRINAVSRILGDASLCVELLTSRDERRCKALVDQVELLNTRRKALQRSLEEQVKRKLATMDLSTMGAIVLWERGWPVGVLGLVASQIAREYGKPTVLLSIDETAIESAPPQAIPNPGRGEVSSPTTPPQAISKPGRGEVSSPTTTSHRVTDQLGAGKPSPYINSSTSANHLARGSARSVNDINFYPILESQRHLLNSFGGHPFAAGMSLPEQNLELFAQGINQALRAQQFSSTSAQVLKADLVVTVADLGQPLFRELKLLEPCGMGNPVPKLLIQNCRFENPANFNIKDWRGGKIRYIKSIFELKDDSSSDPFPGIWWGHYRDELLEGPVDVVGELDFNTYKKQYEFRLEAVRPSTAIQSSEAQQVDWIWDWRRQRPEPSPESSDTSPVMMETSPQQWTDFGPWIEQAQGSDRPLALAYKTAKADAQATWETLLGIAKYMSRTGEAVAIARLEERLGIDLSRDKGRLMGLASGAIAALGFELSCQKNKVSIGLREVSSEAVGERAIALFLMALQEVMFQQRYFEQVPVAAVAQRAQDWRCNAE